MWRVNIISLIEKEESCTLVDTRPIDPRFQIYALKKRRVEIFTLLLLVIIQSLIIKTVAQKL